MQMRLIRGIFHRAPSPRPSTVAFLGLFGRFAVARQLGARSRCATVGVAKQRLCRRLPWCAPPQAFSHALRSGTARFIPISFMRTSWQISCASCVDFRYVKLRRQNQVRIRGYETSCFDFGMDVHIRGTVSWCGGVCVAYRFVHAHGALLRFVRCALQRCSLTIRMSDAFFDIA